MVDGSFSGGCGAVHVSGIDELTKTLDTAGGKLQDRIQRRGVRLSVGYPSEVVDGSALEDEWMLATLEHPTSVTHLVGFLLDNLSID